MAERMIEANGVELCTEPFGDPSDPTILLVMGAAASMLWWEDEFCRGRTVRNPLRPPRHGPVSGLRAGRPADTETDLVGDAVGVLDAYDIWAAHVVGVSAGGAFAQLLALGLPHRVLSLTLVSTSPATPVAAELPPAERFRQFVATADVEWSDRRSVVDSLVGCSGMLAGDERPFDDEAARELVDRDVDRALDIAASERHGVIAGGEVSGEPVSAIAAPTLVIHGTADPSSGRPKPPANGARRPSAST